MSVCIERAYVDRHFNGTIAVKQERAMRDHLSGCEACRAYYERWLLLSELDPAGMSSEQRIGRGLGFGVEKRSFARFIPLGAGTVLSAAAALLLWSQAASHGASPADGFSARGGAHSPISSPSSHVFIYDVRPTEPPTLANESIGRHDELAFAYENSDAKVRLMIFGVDEHRHIYWFYPAWTDESQNPVAVPVEADGLRHELPEAVRQDFDGSKLEIRSVFVDSALSVREVEALLREHPTGSLPIPGAREIPATFSLVNDRAQ